MILKIKIFNFKSKNKPLHFDTFRLQTKFHFFKERISVKSVLLFFKYQRKKILFKSNTNKDLMMRLKIIDLKLGDFVVVFKLKKLKTKIFKLDL